MSDNVLILYRFHSKEKNSVPIQFLKSFSIRLREFDEEFKIPIHFILIADNTPEEVSEKCRNIVIDQFSDNFRLKYTLIHTMRDSDNSRIVNGVRTNKWQPKHFTHFITSMDCVKEYADNDTVIFFCEDDYIYNEGALSKAFRMAKKYKGDFVSLYDGPSHYGPGLTAQKLKQDRPGYELELIREFDVHWRTGDSCCFTYIATLEALKRQGDLFLSPEADWGDCGLWKAMWCHKASKLWTSVPAQVYHNNSVNFESDFWNRMKKQVMCL